jgi:hypothetical protein
MRSSGKEKDVEICATNVTNENKRIQNLLKQCKFANTVHFINHILRAWHVRRQSYDQILIQK